MHRHKFQVLEGLPPYGPVAESCGNKSHSEGFVVRFFPEEGESWVGNYQHSGSDFSSVLEHPNKNDFVVIAGGEAHVIEPVTHKCREEFGGAIDSALFVNELNIVVLGDGLCFRAMNAEGHLWKSKRISFDGFQNIRQEGITLSGEAWSPPDDRWYPFSLNLESGEFTGGSFPLPQ